VYGWRANGHARHQLAGVRGQTRGQRSFRLGTVRVSVKERLREVNLPRRSRVSTGVRVAIWAESERGIDMTRSTGRSFLPLPRIDRRVAFGCGACWRSSRRGPVLSLLAWVAFSILSIDLEHFVTSGVGSAVRWELVLSPAPRIRRRPQSAGMVSAAQRNSHVDARRGQPPGAKHRRG
jgi:hypothetical protein